MPNNLRETIRRAAKSIGADDLLVIVDEVAEQDLPALAKRVMQRGGASLGRIGDALSKQGHITEGARVKAEGRFYEK